MSEKEEVRRLRELKVIEEARFLIRTWMELPDIPEPSRFFGIGLGEASGMMADQIGIIFGCLRKLRTAVEMLDEQEKKDE